MLLSERIEKDYITNYKAKDSLRLGVLRMVKTAAKNKQVELLRPLTEEELLDVFVKQAKQRTESIEQFTAANRLDLAQKEEAELSVLQDYLPKALSLEELLVVIQDTVKKVEAKDMKDMGKVISAVMAQYKAQVDGKILSEQVKRILSA